MYRHSSKAVQHELIVMSSSYLERSVESRKVLLGLVRSVFDHFGTRFRHLENHQYSIARRKW